MLKALTLLKKKPQKPKNHTKTHHTHNTNNKKPHTLQFLLNIKLEGNRTITIGLKHLLVTEIPWEKTKDPANSGLH